MKLSGSINEGDSSDPEDQAASAFVRQQLRGGTNDDETLESRRAEEPDFADAYRRVEQSWVAVGTHSAAPEIMALRERAIARARRANARRWLLSGGGHSRRWQMAAAVAAVSLFLGIALQRWHIADGDGWYRTAYGEQRVVELPDHSRITLDARTRLHVRFTDDVRSVQLLEGQAQFSVAKDPARPFKVEAGGRTIVAVGTVFNVEYVDRQVDVAMVEGRVAVLEQSSAVLPPPVNSMIPKDKGSPIIELNAGEALRVYADGRSTVLPKADIEAATAWRQGKLIFRAETLAEAVRRLNHYSSRQLIVDDAALAKMSISGVFDSGDVQAFADAVQSYLPVFVRYSNEGAIHIKLK
jgi:transmembrane sensor